MDFHDDKQLISLDFVEKFFKEGTRLAVNSERERKKLYAFFPKAFNV